MTLSEHRRALLDKLLAEAGEPVRKSAPPSPAAVPDIENRHAPFPLTDIQLAYWLGRDAQAELGGVASHGYQELAHQELDIERYRSAWNRIIARHGMLRAVILPDGTQQVLAEVPPFGIAVEDYRESSSDTAEAARLATRQRMSHRVFDPLEWPSMEIAVTRMPGGHDIVHMSADALFGDIYSSFVIFHELRQFYDNAGAVLPPLDFTFRDYVLWLKDCETGPGFQAARAYWEAKAPTLPPAPQFPPQPATRPAPPRPEGFRRLRFALPPAAWSALRAAGRQAGASPSALMLTLFSELLARFAGDEAFTLNVTTFNRADIHPQVRLIAGDFTQTMLFAVRTPARGPLEERLRALQADFAQDFEHRAFGGVRTLREMNRQGGGGAGRALMPVVFTSGLGAGDLAEAIPRESRDFVRRVHEITQTPQVTLDHQVFEENGALVVQWDHQPSAFPPGLPETMMDVYRTGLGRLAEDPGLWRCDRLFEPPAVQLSKRARVNATAAPVPPARLEEGFLRQAGLQPNASALICGETETTYAGLLAQAQGWAAALDAAKAGDFVAVSARDPVMRVAGVLGTVLSGRAYVPIEPDWPAERRHSVASAAGIAHAVTDAPGSWNGIAVPLAPAAPDRYSAARSRAPGDRAYTIFTSGSTGVPKGVVLDHAAAWNTISSINARIGIAPCDRLLGVSALGFDLSVYDIFGPLAAGAALVLPPAEQDRDVPAWLRLMRTHQVTIWNSAPALFDLLLGARDADQALALLHHVLLSGDWIPPDMTKRLFAAAPGARLLAMGGATEAAIWSVAHEFSTAPGNVAAIPYGTPLPNQSLHVRDGAMQPVPDWVPGDLYIGGAGLAREYLADPKKTAAAFAADPLTGARLYRTGDLARYREDGVLEFMGRRDTQVKIGGRRVELGEIEAVLARDGRVERAVVRLCPGKGVTAWLRATPGETLPDPDTLARHAARYLPAHMVPAHFLAVRRWPVSANGKLDIKALPQPADAPAEALPEPAAGSAEARLLTLLSEELGRPPGEIGVTQGFFDLGATSVTLIALHRRIAEEFGTELPVTLLFRLANIRALAAHLEGGADSAALREAAETRARLRRSHAARRRGGQAQSPQGLA
ncbi:non-ribosomal peptide synthetase [Rhodovulum sulfidophilum]|uniref:non-ribosomal peptide synthetase n=1 Tax=Rhodovulum sulfidophilum TaxID=35806 RepID=UPI001389FFA0|nr:non-ribosomal peptide synthetase [Rhodovulum sulfidophilum]NDK36506.1 amino acid adenylation domain-containing protein [Rhodovulum sulfidophilum]